MPVNTIIEEGQIQGQILQAAKRLFAVHGLAKVTMEDVAKAIGKGRSSLYYYYKSKDEVFDAVIKIEIKEMVETLEKAVSQVSNTEKKIHAFLVTKLRIVREKGSFFDALKVGMDADALTDFNKIKLAHHNLIMKMEGALLIRILKEGITGEFLRPIKKKEMDTVAFVLLSSLRGLRNEIRTADAAMDAEPAIAQFIKIIMYGLKN